MPTPVSTARQCLTDEAARALDDAVSVARRRSHAQTTSLHAVSALLSLPSSTLRDACCRARTGGTFTSPSSYPPRLQFRALELSVGVSLDRLPSAKGAAATTEEPPISNSLMAVIKRSQANQRRHPDSFHLFNQNLQTTSLMKVEMKYFVLSILDDPIVSRVFADAGFRSCDIKLALIQPLPSRTLSRPVFLCNFEPGLPLPGPGFALPLGIDENSRRIVEVLVRKDKRNPLLIGVYAKNALKSFIELLQKGRGGVLLPPVMAGLRVISIDEEILEFVTGCGNEEKMGVRFEELGGEVEKCLGPGVVVGIGEIEVFVGDSVNNDGGGVEFIVSRLTKLLEVYGGKVWLMGVAETSDVYSKFLRLFPTVENDWDLHLLTVTSATPSMEGLYSKSSLMGSFVPFGGFFPTPSEIRSPASATFTRCDKCNEKYEQEVADVLKVDPATLASSCSTSLPWLQKVVHMEDTHGGVDVAKISEENTSLNDKILGFQKKWSDVCQRLHHARFVPEFDISQTRSQLLSPEVLPFGSGSEERSSKDPSLNEFQCSSPFSSTPKDLHAIFPSKQLSPVPVPSDTVSVNIRTDHVRKVSETKQIDVQNPWAVPSGMARMGMHDHKSSSPVTPVATDLRLGTLYKPTARKPDPPKLYDQIKHLDHLSDSISTDCNVMNENTSEQIARSSCSDSNLEGKFNSVDFKSLNRLLTEKVGWQDQAIFAINQTLHLCQSGAGKPRGSHGRADIWFAFLGSDRIGKKKIASALAETIFGNTESLISVDLGFQYRVYPVNSVFGCQKSYCYDVFRRKTVVDHIAGELSKNPNSVVFLENVDKADFMVQSSLLQAIRRGKFPDSHGREVSINNTIFLITSNVCNGDNSFFAMEEGKMFSEEIILEAKRCQMQLSFGNESEDAKISCSTNVKIMPRKGFGKPSSPSKRKQADTSDCKEGATSKMQKQVTETSRSYLDLNMPLEEGEESTYDSNYKSESIAENSDTWFGDFCDQMDEKVVFNRFDFDALAEKILKSISKQFQRTFSSEFQLEIDFEVMAQILAAAWLADKKNAVEDWVERVLGKCFEEAQQKYHPAGKNVAKLVNCKSIFVEEQAPGVCLPARIDLN